MDGKMTYAKLSAIARRQSEPVVAARMAEADCATLLEYLRALTKELLAPEACRVCGGTVECSEDCVLFPLEALR